MNDWLEQEEKAFEQEAKRHSSCREDYSMLLRVVLFLFLIFFFSSLHSIEPIPEQPVVRLELCSGRYFPRTWTCKQCGYENYEGIERCGLCGRER